MQVVARDNESFEELLHRFRTARDELLISVAGRLASVALAFVFWGLWFGLGLGGGAMGAVLVYLAGVNLLLALFKLIPGFPLDGGRVLRASLWWLTDSLPTATRIAVGAGQVVALLMVGAGIYLAFSGMPFAGLWLLVIGWYLGGAARAAGRQSEAAAWTEGVTVDQVMDSQPLAVGSGASLLAVVHEGMLRSGLRAVPVVDGDWLVGMVSLKSIRAVPRERWAATPARAVMTRLERVETVRPDEGLSVALEMLDDPTDDPLPVVEHGRLVGLVTRGNLARFLEIRKELGVASPDGAQRRAG